MITSYNPTFHLRLSFTSCTITFAEMGSFSEKNDEERVHVSIDSQQVDTGAHLDASLKTTLDPDEPLRIM